MHTQFTPDTVICPVCDTPFTPTASNLRRGGGKYCSQRCYHTARSTFDPARFWDKVRKTDGCWTWEGAGHGDGYGVATRNRKPVLAHRLAYELEFGAIPEGLFVCHHCDNPTCVRPDHLFLGDHADNMGDMKSKGRGRTQHRPGEASPTAKLTEHSVMEIRRLVSHGIPYSEIADKFGVTKSAVCDIIRRRTWAHLP